MTFMSETLQAKRDIRLVQVPKTVSVTSLEEYFYNGVFFRKLEDLGGDCRDQAWQEVLIVQQQREGP